MRTSRVSRDTARMVQALSTPRRQTRTLTKALERSEGDVSDTETRRHHVKKNAIKKEASESPLSSSSSPSTPDIEDIIPVQTPASSRKRKRGEVAATMPSTASISRVIRSSPRKSGVKDADEYDGPTRPPKAKRQPAKQVKGEDGEVVIHAPPNWEEVYSLTQEMRKNKLAPVDTMGCENLAEDHMTPRDRRYQTLTALMLSSQTKDTTTGATIKRLQNELPEPGLTLENILEVDPTKLNELIWAVGFHNNKTRYIKATAEMLRDRFNGDIPDTIEGMISLPGVGPKMAYLCMSSAWGRDEGIGVDVHVHRITNLWGWHITKTPEETRAMLESWLPKEKWHDINHLLVGFGQTICAPVGRKCGDCTLNEKGLCPSAVVDRKIKVRKLKKEDEDLQSGKDVGELSIKEEDTVVDGSKIMVEAAVKDEEA